MDIRIRKPDGLITAPGLYDMADALYHSDPVAVPSLSSSTGATLLNDSPRHAWAGHPRLGGALIDDEDDDDARLPTRDMEIGTIVHALLLGKGPDIALIDAKDYKRTAAKEARANAYANGQAPILAADMKRVNRIVAEARDQLHADGLSWLFDSPGWSEIVLAWQDEAGPWCRAMLDRLVMAEGRALIADIKTSGTAVNPIGPGLGYKLADMAYEMRAAFYERGLVHLHPELAGRVAFWHVWIETKPPFSLVVTEMDAASRTIGAKKAAAAIGLWRDCLAAGTGKEYWPRYAGGLHRIEYPARSESQWIEREVSDERIAALINADPFIGNGRLSEPAPARLLGAIDTLMGG